MTSTDGLQPIPTVGYFPQFAIINGVQQSNYDPWEVLYMQTGYGYGDYWTFRDYIDQVVPSLLGDANGDRKVNDLDASILGAIGCTRVSMG